uniref:Uncharacterized protein n=1 Tax=viral metagenome TaxID=1070528 RepID=A0A6C0K342_9ZZZZ
MTSFTSYRPIRLSKIEPFRVSEFVNPSVNTNFQIQKAVQLENNSNHFNAISLPRPAPETNSTFRIQKKNNTNKNTISLPKPPADTSSSTFFQSSNFNPEFNTIDEECSSSVVSDLSADQAHGRLGTPLTNYLNNSSIKNTGSVTTPALSASKAMSVLQKLVQSRSCDLQSRR